VSNVESNGSHVIAEYDGNNNLLRKYIYGPGIDQPVSMIEVADSNATYYYHYDGNGSVIALSDSAGDTVQTYEYSVFGEPAVEDANHTNPYMFAGRRYDIEIGLYYNRARYYNPYTGRFLQTDPAGDGMNLYAYCGNNPVGRVDPSGLYWTFLDSCYVAEHFNQYWGQYVFAWVDDEDENPVSPDISNVEVLWSGASLEGWYKRAKKYFEEGKGHAEGWKMEEQIGYEFSRLSGRQRHDHDWYFWRLQAMRFLSKDVEDVIKGIEGLTGDEGQQVLYFFDSSKTMPVPGRTSSDTNWTWVTKDFVMLNWDSNFNGEVTPGQPIPNLVSFTHELYHTYDALKNGTLSPDQAERENPAIALENQMRLAFYWKVPGYTYLWPLRPGF